MEQNTLRLPAIVNLINQLVEPVEGPVVGAFLHKNTGVITSNAGYQYAMWEVTEGETLLLPAFWHHEVHSEATSAGDVNVAVNFWFRNVRPPPEGF